MAVGEYLDGLLRTMEDHFTFVQNDQEKLQKVVQRNPHVYEGKYINVNRKKTVRSTLPSPPQFSERFTFRTSARVPPTSCVSLAARVMTDKQVEAFLGKWGLQGRLVTDSKQK